MITIDGNTYNIPIISVTRKADFLDKYAERTEDGVLHRELIGVYYNYQLKFGKTDDRAEYQRLWDKLSEPEEFHTITIIDSNDSIYTFTAYFSNVGDEYRHVKSAGGNYYGYFSNLTVNFISKEPSRV